MEVRVVVYVPEGARPRSGRLEYEAACVDWDVQAAAADVATAMAHVKESFDRGPPGAAGWVRPIPRRYGGAKGLYSLMWDGRHSNLEPLMRERVVDNCELRFGLSDLRSYRDRRKQMEQAPAGTPGCPPGEAKTVRLIIFRERTQAGEVYVGQCLEYDHSTQGDSIQSVIFRTELGLMAELRLAGAGIGSPPFLKGAPGRFEEMWARRRIAVSRVEDAWPPELTGFRLDIALAERA